MLCSGPVPTLNFSPVTPTTSPREICFEESIRVAEFSATTAAEDRESGPVPLAPRIATGNAFSGEYSCVFPNSAGSRAIIAATASGIGTSAGPLHCASSKTSATLEILSSFDETLASTTWPLRMEPSRSLQSPYCQASLTLSRTGEPAFRKRASSSATSSAWIGATAGVSLACLRAAGALVTTEIRMRCATR